MCEDECALKFPRKHWPARLSSFPALPWTNMFRYVRLQLYDSFGAVPTVPTPTRIWMMSIISTTRASIGPREQHRPRDRSGYPGRRSCIESVIHLWDEIIAGTCANICKWPGEVRPPWCHFAPRRCVFASFLLVPRVREPRFTRSIFRSQKPHTNKYENMRARSKRVILGRRLGYSNILAGACAKPRSNKNGEIPRMQIMVTHKLRGVCALVTSSLCTHLAKCGYPEKDNRSRRLTDGC